MSKEEVYEESEKLSLKEVAARLSDIWKPTYVYVKYQTLFPRLKIRWKKLISGKIIVEKEDVEKLLRDVKRKIV